MRSSEQANAVMHASFTQRHPGTRSSMRPLYSQLAAVLFDPVFPRAAHDTLLHFRVDTIDGDEVGVVGGSLSPSRRFWRSIGTADAA